MLFFFKRQLWKKDKKLQTHHRIKLRPGRRRLENFEEEQFVRFQLFVEESTVSENRLSRSHRKFDFHYKLWSFANSLTHNPSRTRTQRVVQKCVYLLNKSFIITCLWTRANCLDLRLKRACSNLGGSWHWIGVQDGGGVLQSLSASQTIIGWP